MKDERKPVLSFIPHPSSLIPKLKRALRGEVDARTVALEAWRRSRVKVNQRRERARLEQLNEQPVRLRQEFARLSSSGLLQHFRHRSSPKFFSGFDAFEKLPELQKSHFPSETAQLIESASRIHQQHRWPLLGYSELDFGAQVEWRRDLLSGDEWPLDYHVEVNLARAGADVRVLWELNRMAHQITLARAYAVTFDEELAEEFFAQLESWREQNPVGRGPNWACAMEVALRSINLLAAFILFRHSERMSEKRLLDMLSLFEQHGAHIRRNLEFSYIATSNHYLSDVVGLFWLGVLLPELHSALAWREFGLREMLKEMDAQILADGADCEASTGYHRLVLELFLYSFILARENKIEIAEKYWLKLRAMLDYIRAYMRPDGRAPLIGDTDNGQVLPLVRRAADDHAYLVSLGAVAFDEADFKSHAIPEELLWVFGEAGMKTFDSLPLKHESQASQAFIDAGTYVMRAGDAYLLFNASGGGLYGRGSHGHNDVLSVEVSACGASFITDPGTYVYRTDLHERHLFRSTAYHSTVEVNNVEQNTIHESMPFITGNEAQPRVIEWETSDKRDLVIAEHTGYARFEQPVTHRRAVEFDKAQRIWLIEDSLTGAGEHVFKFRFHLAHKLETNVRADGKVLAYDKIRAARLFIIPLEAVDAPTLEPCWTSREYGAKMPSVSVCWTVSASAPLTLRWALVPVCKGEDEAERIKLVEPNRKSEI